MSNVNNAFIDLAQCIKFYSQKKRVWPLIIVTIKANDHYFSVTFLYAFQLSQREIKENFLLALYTASNSVYTMIQTYIN